VQDRKSSAGMDRFRDWIEEIGPGRDGDVGRRRDATAMRDHHLVVCTHPDAKPIEASTWCGCGRKVTNQGHPSLEDRWILDRLESGTRVGTDPAENHASQSTHVGTLNCQEIHVLAVSIERARTMTPSLHFSIRDHDVDHNPTMYALDVTHSVEVVMHALCTKAEVKEVTISLPYQAFFRMKKLMEVFANSLMQRSSRLQCITLRPVDTFSRHPDFKEMQRFLDDACRLQTFSFLSGTHARLGRCSPVRRLPPNTLQSIVSMFVFKLSND